MTLLADLGEYLEDNGGGVVVGTSLFYGTMPPTPDACGVLIEYEGRGMLRRIVDDGAQTEMPRVQLVYRSTTYTEGMTAIRTMWALLDAIVNTELGTTFYQRVSAIQPPFYVERDGNDRFLFAANFEVTRESS